MAETDNFARMAGRLFDGVLQVDTNGRVVLWNSGAERITGYAAARVVGKPYNKQPARHLSPAGQELPESAQPLLATLKDGNPREGISHFKHAEGFLVSIITRTLAIQDESDAILGGVEVFNDNRTFIAAFQASQRTEETVLLDPLTGIGNRRHIETKLRLAIEEYHVKKTPFGVLFIDIDHFKDFNDTHGHLVGDKILRLVANTVRQNMRLSDSCGRWGGEEFVALANDLNMEGLQTVSEKLRATIEGTRVQDKGLDLNVTVSIGATLIHSNDTLQSIIDRSDKLMYRSKREGRNRATVEE